MSRRERASKNGEKNTETRHKNDIFPKNRSFASRQSPAKRTFSKPRRDPLASTLVGFQDDSVFGKMWLRRLEVPPNVLASLYSLYTLQGDSQILDDATIRGAVDEGTLGYMQEHFRNTAAGIAPMKGLQMTDGILFDCNDRKDFQNGFAGELFLSVTPSRTLERDFCSLFISSQSVYVPFHRNEQCNCQKRTCSQSTIDSLLTKLYPKWKNVKLTGKDEAVSTAPSLGTSAANTNKPSETVRQTVRQTKPGGKPLKEAQNVLGLDADCEPLMGSIQITRRHDQDNANVIHIDVQAFQKLRTGLAQPVFETKIPASAHQEASFLIENRKANQMDVKITLADCQLCYSVSGRVFGTIAEKNHKDVFAYGSRLLLNNLIASDRQPPTVFEAADMHGDLAQCDNLIQVVRSFGLETSFQKHPLTLHLFDMLNIRECSEKPKPESDTERCSVFPLSYGVQVSGIAGSDCVGSLAKFQISLERTHAALVGAYAVYTQKHLFQSKDVAYPVLMNVMPYLSGRYSDLVQQWREGVRGLGQNPTKQATAETFTWYGQEISMNHAKYTNRGCSTDILCFADTDGVFAIYGQPPAFGLEVPSTFTPYAEGLAGGYTVDVAVPDPSLQQSLQGDTLRHSLMRLACIDMLTTSFPEFGQNARVLRAIWLHSEDSRLRKLELPREEFCSRMCVLHQAKKMPAGINYWSTVPYFE